MWSPLFFSWIFFFFSHAVWKFLGQGLNLSLSRDLRHSYGNAGSLTHCATVGIPSWIFNRNSGSSPITGSDIYIFFCLIIDKRCSQMHALGIWIKSLHEYFCISGHFSFFFSFFKATPDASGSSQARSLIRASAAGLHHSHSNARSELQQPIPVCSNARPLTHWVGPGIKPASS